LSGWGEMIAGCEGKGFMQVYRLLEKVPPPGEKGAAITMGFFDGLHVGHRRILEKVCADGNEAGMTKGVVTFEPHPLTLLAPDSAPLRLSLPGEKLELLSGFDLDFVLVMEFDSELRNTEAADFVKEVLFAGLQTRKLIAGYDTRFGRGGRGDVAFLESVSDEYGFDVETVDPVMYGKRVISSTAVRSAVEAGEMDIVKGMLGRCYSVRGKVVKGLGLGRKLGVRTANLDVAPEKLLPARGVHAVYAQVEGGRHRAVANIGYRPTIPQEDPVLCFEVHMPGFDEDIYEKYVTVEFERYIRGEMKFENLDSLKARMRKDIDIAMDIL